MNHSNGFKRKIPQPQGFSLVCALAHLRAFLKIKKKIECPY